jgi:hypothetical protein
MKKLVKESLGEYLSQKNSARVDSVLDQVLYLNDPDAQSDMDWMRIAKLAHRVFMKNMDLVNAVERAKAENLPNESWANLDANGTFGDIVDEIVDRESVKQWAIDMIEYLSEIGGFDPTPYLASI